jgi:hypothetical protein
MKKILILSLLLIPFVSFGQTKEESDFKKNLKKNLKFATLYTAVTGNNSLADVNTYSLLPDGSLEYGSVQTPFDYTLAFGVRKIARLGYENRKNVFYNGTETSVSDAATVGRIKGLEFLFEADYKRQQGNYFVDQQHFLRYVHDHWILKGEYVQDGFADIKYFESSQRYRYNVGEKLSFNVGLVQRFSEPYGFNPLSDLVGADFTLVALDEGYYSNFEGQWFDSDNNQVADNSEIWRGVVLPDVLNNYVEQERSQLPNQWNHSLVLGYDYYHYTKDLWLHSWASALPLHVSSKNEFSYTNFIEGNQWFDYTAGLIFGYKINKSLGVFLEGKYHKYWNRNWHDFSVGFNYVII